MRRFTTGVASKADIGAPHDDNTTSGILHSRFHELWSLRMGTSLEERPRYTPFETFPFPAGLAPKYSRRRLRRRSSPGCSASTKAGHDLGRGCGDRQHGAGDPSQVVPIVTRVRIDIWYISIG
jgi:hypothetical protein